MRKLKYLLFALIISLFCSYNVSATEYSYDDLITYMTSEQTGVDYFYLVGDRIFTSKNKLTLEDLMVGAHSIVVENGISEEDLYSKMATYLFDADYDDDYNLRGYVLSKNFTGSAKMDKTKKIKVNYIDKVEVEKLTTVVNNEDSLIEALNNEDINTIILGSDFEVTSNISIDRDVTIKGNNKTIRKTSSVKPNEVLNNFVFVVNNKLNINGVNIENGLYGIKVNEGAN